MSSLRVLFPDRDEDVELRVVCDLDQGANSAAQLVKDPQGKLLALKRSLRADGSDSHLKIEEKILAQLDHPNVVRLVGSGTDSASRQVLLYELLFENPLLIVSKPAIRRHFSAAEDTFYFPLPPEIALAHSVDLLRGLEHLHQHGFVHHDIKPHNLMVRMQVQDGMPSQATILRECLSGRTQLVLIDIGSSRSKGYLRELNEGKHHEDLYVVQPEMTPLFAPPEALLPAYNESKRPWLHHSLDLYAAALTIYSSITGHLPYDGARLETLEEIRDIKLRERDGAVTAINRGAILGAPGYGRVAEDLLELLTNCISPFPEERPTVGDAREYLQAILEQLPSVLRSQDSAAAEEVFFGVAHHGGVEAPA